jgi:hypothetical protein
MPPRSGGLRCYQTIRRSPPSPDLHPSTCLKAARRGVASCPPTPVATRPLLLGRYAPAHLLACTRSGGSRDRGARPNIWRVSILRRSLCPSTGPVLQGRVTPALTAASSSPSPLAKRRQACNALAAAHASQASRRGGGHWRRKTSGRSAATPHSHGPTAGRRQPASSDYGGAVWETGPRDSASASA